MSNEYDIPSEDKVWLQKVGQIAPEKPKTTKKDEE